MPKTKCQKILFSILMSFAMVYGMEVYNCAIRNKGLDNSSFLLPVGELALLMLMVIVIETLIGGPIARRIAFKHLVNPQICRPILTILAVQTMTVCVMCPLMSLVATLAFKGGVNSKIVATWVQTVAINFPMAFCWQVFVAGPLVRLIVRAVFRRQKVKAAD